MAKFVKITSNDEDGEFSYTGQLIRENSKGALVRTGIAEMFFPKGDYTMKNARTPRNFNATVDTAVDAVVEAKSNPVKAEKATKAKKITKVSLAADILSAVLKQNAEASRQEMIGVIMDQMNIADKARASGLYQAAIKRV